jgi:hypothetical protein
MSSPALTDCRKMLSIRVINRDGCCRRINFVFKSFKQSEAVWIGGLFHLNRGYPNLEISNRGLATPAFKESDEKINH